MCWSDPGTETDTEGTPTGHSHDALKRPQSVTRQNIVTSYRYDAAGHRLATYRQGTNGNVITLETAAYDLLGRTRLQVNAQNGATRMDYAFAAAGQSVVTTTYPDGGTRVETYYQDGTLRALAGTAVAPVRYEYGVEPFNGVSRAFTREIKLDAQGQDTDEWVKTYADAQDRTIAVVYPDHAARLSEYDAQGHLVKETDPDGVVVLHQYNALGEEEYTAVDVNKNGRIDLAGPDRVTRAVRDYAQRDGYTVQRHQSFEWPEFGQAEPRLASTRETTLNAEKATLTWDIRYGLTNRSRVDYPGNGARVATTIAPDGSQAVSVYQEGRLLTASRRDATGAALGRTTFEYDPHGRQAFVSDARNGRTGYEYNDADQPVRVTTPPPAEGLPPQVTQTQYDAMGRVFTVTYPDLATVTNEYHSTGALKAKYGARTYPVAYTYDPQGRMQTMTTWGDFAKNAGARVTTWQYHPQRGWLTAKLYPDQKGPSYDYWPSGKIKTRQWVRDIATNYRYDESGRVKNVDYTDTNTPPVAYAYDRLGRPSKITQGDSVTERAYGPAGQMLGESYTGGPLDGLTVANAYDAYLRRTNLLARTTAPGGKKQADDLPLAATWYGYDAASRLQTVSDGQYSAQYHYLANSPLVEQIDYRNGEVLRMTTLKKHDHLNRLESIESQPSTDKRIAYTYRYNQANQRTNAVLADNTAWNYGYDDLGQLTNGVKVDPQSKPVDTAAYQYSYDTIGNRKTAVAGGIQVDYQVDALNRYTNAVAVVRGGDVKPSDPNAISSPGGIDQNDGGLLARTGASQFDADGNLKSDANWVYTWDAENRLIAMESGAGISPANRKRLEFQYDSQSRRIAKRVYSWTADRRPLTSGLWSLTSDLRFVYDGWNLMAELTRDAISKGAVKGNAYAVLRSYLWGMDLSGSLQGAGGIGGLLAVADHSSQTARHFVSYDGNGNVVGLTDANDGTVADRYEYDPFGNEITTAKGHSLANPFRFSTKYTDEETGLVYYGYRYYCPANGKWVSRDPLEEKGGLNLQGFVANDPVHSVDRLGLDPTQLATYKASLAQDKQRFVTRLELLCPDQNDISVGEGKCAQTCKPLSCYEQAQALADRLAADYETVFTTEFNRFGNIVTGWNAGNGRADLAPNHGEMAPDYDKGYGLKCLGWQELTTDAFYAVIRPYRRAGTQCFRGAAVGKPTARNSYANHSWFLIYGPSRGKLTKTMYHQGEYDIAVDPWPFAGSLIINPNPYVAQRLDASVLW
nr:RHS repeat-associated core domain-containing protein [uncultured Methanoregula sp.]